MTIFSKIIKGEVPCHKIYEDEKYFAFLDINPIQQGHTLVIPKEEIDDVFDLDDDTYTGLMNVVKKISFAVKKASGSVRVGLMVMGLEVPHAHVHLIPINNMGDMKLSNAKKASNEELKEIAEKIRKHL